MSIGFLAKAVAVENVKHLLVGMAQTLSLVNTSTVQKMFLSAVPWKSKSLGTFQ